MAIKSNAGPIHGRAVMQKALAARAPQARAFSTPLGGAPQTGSPVPVYHLPLDRLQDSDPLAAVTLTSWRYPVIGGLHPGLADIREGQDGRTASFGGLSHGILADRFMLASMLAEQELAGQPEEFEPRLLDVPALQFAALWLRGRVTGYMVSLLDGRPPGTAPLKLVNEHEVVPELQTRAATRSLRAGAPGAPRGGGPTGTPTN